MIAFDMDGKVRKPKFELDSEQVRYEHRFAPFNSVITPPPVHYLQFKVSNLETWKHGATHAFIKVICSPTLDIVVIARRAFDISKFILKHIKISGSSSLSCVQGKYIALISY